IAMGDREVWRHDGESVQFYRLAIGKYEPILTSSELPGLQASLINQFLERRLEFGETTFIREFRSVIG
ncbi:MAG TPA: hypothetical protein VM260_16300, partial [Pirellula sp.]|nr:hypothetical protein [Pirellula sp.]